METQNIKFSDQSDQWTTIIDSEPDPTFSVADTTDADLGNFFSRPVKIRAFDWAVGDNLYQNFNPWDDYFGNKRVANRISNFNLLRCKLHVKFIINGNSFYYGKAIAMYEPLAGLVGQFTSNRSTVTEDLVNLSQQPHIFLDPTMSQGGSLLCPFFWYKNALEIPKAEWGNMGSLRLRSFSPLKHANGATDSLTVSVFAWAEDVSLSIPTSDDVLGLQAQAGPMDNNDEYGIISGPANVLSSIAGRLQSLPTIGPFAMATKIAADAVGGVARIFGHSKPVDICPPGRMLQNPLGNTANTNVADSSQKLSLDSKQELTIDPRVMGLSNTDEMTIRSIASRESYLTQFGWTIANNEEDLLWTSEVSPVLWAESDVGDPVSRAHHLPACAFASLPFRNWRGSIKFRFMILNSAYHKGRLAIKYDPSFFESNEYNTNYVKIVDIAKERDFTVEVGWGQALAFLNHRDVFTDPIPYGTSTRGPTATNTRNGVLEVRVVNELTTPNSTANNDIQVLVFVSAGDDFEVANPDERPFETATWFPQSGEVELASMPILDPQAGDDGHADAEGDCDMDMPMTSDATHEMASTLSLTDNTQAVYFGDPVVSFRQCLKRWNFYTSWLPSQNNDSGFLKITNSDFPFHRGNAPGAIYPIPAPGSGSWNYCNMILLTYLAPAFLARRGALRHMYTVSETFSPQGIYAVRRLAEATSVANVFQPLPNVQSPESSRLKAIMGSYGAQWSGACNTSARQNPVISAEMPFYSNVRFMPSRKPNWTTNTSFMKNHEYTAYLRVVGANKCFVYNHVSVGEDFNLGMYIGPPLLYTQASP